MGNFDLAICPGLSVFIFICHSLYKAWLFEKFISDLESSSCSFKITCILLRQVISSKKMVMSSAKFTNLISWFPICTPLILLSASMKLASTWPALIYDTDESEHPWRTPCIRVKGSDRRPFILILDWMSVYATLIMRMNLTPYPNFCKSEEIKSQSTLPKTLRILQRGFNSIYLTYQLHIVLFLIAADCFSFVIVTEVYCIQFLRILG